LRSDLEYDAVVRRPAVFGGSVERAAFVQEELTEWLNAVRSASGPSAGLIMDAANAIPANKRRETKNHPTWRAAEARKTDFMDSSKILKRPPNAATLAGFRDSTTASRLSQQEH
jgi:hypothetical protein